MNTYVLVTYLSGNDNRLLIQHFSILKSLLSSCLYACTFVYVFIASVCACVWKINSVLTALPQVPVTDFREDFLLPRTN